MLSVALFFSAVPLKAQTEVGIDLGLFSSYVWRGVTTTNKGSVYRWSAELFPGRQRKHFSGSGRLAGFNAGRGIPDDPLSDEISNYEDDGFTHLDLSAGVPFALGTVSITPVVHFVVNGDDRTKTTSPTDLNQDVKLWGGVSLG